MRILFIGTGDIGLPTLRAIFENREQHELLGVVTQPDKPAGRKQELLASPVKQLAEQRGIAVFQPQKIRAPDAVAQIAAMRAEVIVVMAYGQILPRGVLDAASVACLNLHASLLPRWRGAAPIQAAIEAGDFETGITVMFMDEGLDTGDILLQKKIAIRADETGGSLHERLAMLAPEALNEALTLIQHSVTPRISQNSALATYAPKLEREHGEIDWLLSAEIIERKIRALNPWPVAFTMLPGRDGHLRKLKIFSAEIFENSESSGAAPGEILSAQSRDGLVVATGNGALRLREIQLEGKRRLSASEFLLGNPISTGSVFRTSF